MNGVFANSTLRGKTARIFAAFMLFAFLFGTAVEAAACATDIQAEITSTAIFSPDQPDDDHSDDTGETHAVCVHGHCHHTGKLVGSDLAMGAFAMFSSALAVRHDDVQPDAFTDRLDRPPRL